jgi:hypothetical protein
MPILGCLRSPTSPTFITPKGGKRRSGQCGLQLLGRAFGPEEVGENLWAAPFASDARRGGGQLIAYERIPAQAIVPAIEADGRLEAEGA